MQLLVGYPDSVFNASAVVEYYKDVPDMAANAWLNNINAMNDWYIEQNIHTFVNNVFPMLSDWPIIFSQKDAFQYWLTGVNAFYYPGPSVDGSNFFTIPTTITQKTFFDEDYPSAINFGGLGSLCGKEMAHGFDTIGLQYDINGSYAGNIYTNASRDALFAKMQCFVGQYDDLSVNDEDVNVTVNGNDTLTDNVADNIGLKTAYSAWKAFKQFNNEQTRVLPGVDLTDGQLFFWSYASFYCEANRPNVFDNFTSSYTPNYVKVIGALQNNQDFADAFGCKTTSFMNSENKCVI